jgi:hypothetical protein
MTASSVTAFVEELENTARAAATVEERFHRDMVRRFAEPERTRQFAYRRF